MRLRPSGSKGPVSLRLSAMADYYAREAETWELMTLTRARLVWASDPAFGASVETALETALRRPRPDANLAADVRKMRDLMDRERPASGFWDLKLAPGGLVDAEFAAQFGQLRRAAAGESLTVSTLAALDDAPALSEAWRVQQRLSHILASAFEDRPDLETEPEGLQRRLAEAVGETDLEGLKRRLTELRAAARAAFEDRLPTLRDG